MSNFDLIKSTFQNAIDKQSFHVQEFLVHIPLIIDTFNKDFVSASLIPFIKSLLPFDNVSNHTLLIKQIPLLCPSCSSVNEIIDIIETLLLQEDSTIRKEILRMINERVGEEFRLKIFQKISVSKYDVIRVFSINLVNVLSNEEKEKSLFSFACDSAFKVRLATVKYLTNLNNDDLVKRLCLVFVDDANPRIRAALPKACKKMEFYFNEISDKLCEDLDWYVRVNFAMELLDTLSNETALKYGIKLLKDKVWYVKLHALRVLNNLIKKVEDIEMINISDLFKSMLNICCISQIALKNAVCDIVFTLSQIINLQNYDNYFQLFAEDVITRQSEEMKLYFLTQILKYKSVYLMDIIKENLFDLIKRLISSESWRIRLGIVNMLHKISKFIKDKEIDSKIQELCYPLINDKAELVRNASIGQMIMFTKEKDSLIPKFYKSLAVSNTFRERQAALLVLQNILKTTKKKNSRKILLEEVEKFEKDECPNVVELANDIKKKNIL